MKRADTTKRSQTARLIGGMFTLLALQIRVALPTWAQGGLLSGNCTLDVGQVGSTFEESIGFGGLRIGAPEAEITAQWGGTGCLQSHLGPQYQYLLRGRNDDEAVLLIVVTPNGVVSQIGVVLIPHAPSLGPPIRTTAGIAMGSPAADVRRTYGTPDRESHGELWYVSRGVAFALSGDAVFGFFVFKPGTGPPP